jgi:hypothetical protein
MSRFVAVIIATKLVIFMLKKEYFGEVFPIFLFTPRRRALLVKKIKHTGRFN